VCLDVCRQILDLYSGRGPSATTQQPKNPSGNASVVVEQQAQSPPRKASVSPSTRRRSSSSVSALCCVLILLLNLYKVLFNFVLFHMGITPAHSKAR